MNTTPSPEKNDAARIDALIEAHRHRSGALLPLLHAVQDALGCIPADAVPRIATALNLSRAEVHGVVSYYHHFRSEPAGRHVVQVCRAEACQACGADELLAQAEALLGCKSHSTRGDGAVTLEPVYCLGLCASSPAVQIDEKLHARVTPAKLQRLAQALEIAR
ncbi:formate dehydrogenase subunit gamma [Azohydromonas australica]|uniref:formate dehydrogenase subunit gamma n=1 Tax=Azohydromonas australica TaxID=364039 RepID=UPI00048F62E4|nr:formate dehydrogenase subunit gamma [Azohydromonas australica]